MSMKKWMNGLVLAAGVLSVTACTEGLITGEGEEAAPEEDAPARTDEDTVIPEGCGSFGPLIEV